MAEDINDISWDAKGKAEEAVRQYVTNIIDMNHQALTLLRERRDDFYLLRDAFNQMAEWAEEAGDQCAVKARQIADLSGEVISAEYQLVPVNPEDEEDDEDSECANE